MKIFKALRHHDHVTKQTDPSISLSDMVDNIINKHSFYEGSSHLIIDKIVSLKNSTNADGMKEITEAWGKVNKANGKAKYKINKYFNKGIEASKNYFSLPPNQSLSTGKIKIEQKKDTLDKKVIQKSCSGDLPNGSIKKTTPLEGNATDDVIIKKMKHCENVVAKLGNEVVDEKVSGFINELSIRKNKLSQPEPSEKEPKFQKILASHTIEEAIEIKVPFNGISDKSLNLIESKIKAKFNELKSSKNPEFFEREMFNAQGILKKYDNKLVCEKINNIINKFLDRNELYIRENKVPMDRIWCAINSVSSLQDITPRKYNEFKMAIIDYLKKEPIEDIFESSSELIRKVSRYTHKNIADKVNNFINVYSMDRVKELKGNEKFSVASKIELLEPEKNRDPEELMKDMSLKKIVSHVFSRMINNIRRLFSKN